MLTFILAIGLGTCAAGWLVNRIYFLTVLEWIVRKGYTPPTSEEVKACTQDAVRRMFGLK